MSRRRGGGGAAHVPGLRVWLSKFSARWKSSPRYSFRDTFVPRCTIFQVLRDRTRAYIFGWISWFNPVDFLGDPVEICSLGAVYA